MKLPKLQRGLALVLVGPHGSTIAMAREISAMAGSWAQLDLHLMVTPDKFAPWLRKKLDTLIVEGLPTNAPERSAVKPYIANHEVVINEKGKPVALVKTPNFIFCTGDPRPLRFVDNDRRFHVVRVPAK